MDKISNWEARRSGGRITINGKDESGMPIKVAAIDAIEVVDGRIIATKSDETEFELLAA